MRKLFLVSAFLVSTSFYVSAQNKTLGVGIITPNPNAALHVGSPTDNQGFLMPKLTTAQRTAMVAIPLGAADAGLMVYDTDLKSTCTWDGSVWVTSAKPFPVNETITNSVAGSSLFRIVNSGTAAGNFGVASFENTNPNSGFSAIFGSTNSATNGVADFVVANATNNNDGIGVTTNGVGTAGRFTVNNTGGLNPAIWAQTNSNQPLSATIYGLNTGTGDGAGVFRINNASNNFSAVYGETNGNSTGVYGINKNTGAIGANGVMGEVNSNVWGIGVFGKHTGTSGFAGSFEIQNSANGGWGVKGSTDGTGAGVYGANYGTADGFAGLFETTDAANAYPAIQATTRGTGPGVRVVQTPTGIGGGMDVMIQNTANSSLGFSVDHQGIGTAGSFNINNAGSNGSALYAQSNGTGSAITASQINNGLALNVSNGGVRYNVTTVSSTGSIANRSAVYQIVVTGTFTLGWTLAPGDVIHVFNSNGIAITFAGQTINANVLSQLIYIGGAWRMNN